MINLTAFILFTDVVLLYLLISFAIRSRRWVKKMEKPYSPGSFKSNIFIESALSLDL